MQSTASPFLKRTPLQSILFNVHRTRAPGHIFGVKTGEYEKLVLIGRKTRRNQEISLLFHWLL